VRDEDDDAAGAGDLPGALDEPLRFVGSQCRGGLVEDHDPRSRREHLRGLDEMTIRHREGPDRAVHIDPMDAELLEKGLGLPAEPPGRDSTERRQRLLTDPEVLRDCEVGNERQLLEDGADVGG
jgi:hypothetical protein